MSVDNTVDNTKQAVKEMLAGAKLGEVSARYSVDKGTLSKMVKGALLGIELRAVDNTPQTVVDNDNDCETCKKVKALTTEMETLRTAVDNRNIVDNSFDDDTTAQVVDNSAEVQALTTERDELRTVVDNAQTEIEGLRSEISAMTEEISALHASASETAPEALASASETETLGPDHGLTIAGLKAYIADMGQDPAIAPSWPVVKAFQLDMQDKLADKDMEISLKRDDIKNYKKDLQVSVKTAVRLRQIIDPNWSPFEAYERHMKTADPLIHGYTDWSETNRKIKEASGETKDKLILELSSSLVEVLDKDSKNLAPASVSTVQPDHQEPAKPDNVMPAFDSSPMNVAELQEAKRTPQPEKTSGMTGMTGMNAEAKAMVKTCAVPDERLASLAEHLSGESVGMKIITVVAYPALKAWDMWKHRN